jgi:hypothetical protein
MAVTTTRFLSLAIEKPSRHTDFSDHHSHDNDPAIHAPEGEESSPILPPSLSEIASEVPVVEGVAGCRVLGNEGTASFMTMHLEGFHSSAFPLIDSEGVHECLSFLGLWKIRSRVSLLFSAFVAFGLACGLEFGVSLLTRLQDRQKQIPLRKHRRLLAALTAIIYLLGYSVMLVAMTYSLELLAALVIGHMVGHFRFAGSSPSASSAGPFSSTARDAARISPSWAKSHQKESRSKALSSFVRSLWATNRESHRESFALFAFPAARERVRRQRQPKTRREIEGHHQIRSEGDSDDESEELEESTTRDEDDLPFLRKREVMR